MKTVVLFLFPFLCLSCDKPSPVEAPPVAAIEVDTPAPAPCPFPEYDPPDVVPGTGCRNPCQFVYEGWVDFEGGVLQVNCLRLPLSSPALAFSVDSTIIRHVGYGFLKVLRIQAPGIGAWCAGKVFFLAEGCPAPERHMLLLAHDGMSEFRVIWPKGFWDCAAGKRINFRIIARNPLALEGGGEP